MIPGSMNDHRKGHVQPASGNTGDQVFRNSWLGVHTMRRSTDSALGKTVQSLRTVSMRV